jgi:hypothetical protein
MTTIREKILGPGAMDPYIGMPSWAPMPGLNLFSINFSGTVYNQVGTLVTIHLCGLFASYLSDSGATVVFGNLPIPATAGGPYVGVVEIRNFTTGVVQEDGVLTINPGVSTTNLIMTCPPPENFQTENLVFCVGTITYSV